MDAIRTLSYKNTMFIISHRPATLKDCDLVSQIANGKVTMLQEEGKFLRQ